MNQQVCIEIQQKNTRRNIYEETYKDKNMDRTTQKDIHMKNINRDMYTETNLQTKSMKKITRRMDNV